MANVPNNFNDPYWSELASKTESKLGLPDGLLVSIVTKGERSNADQVSEAGARTPFQIIPQTRKAAIDKYGIDPYLSPENAAEVSGLLLKDSIKRNKGDVASAVAEYHGGTDRANWGPRTKSYVNRVMVAQNQQPETQSTSQPSTFQRVMAANSQQSTNSIANVYQAYKAGKMTPEESAQFEKDVKGGLVMLPQGANLLSQPPADSPVGKPGAILLPQSVTDAYVQGKMSKQERADLESDMKAGLVKLPPTAVSQIPGGAEGVPTEQGIIQQQKDPTFIDKAIGVGETGLSTLTGLTGGTFGSVIGTVNGLGQTIANGTFGTPEGVQQTAKRAGQAAQALTYQPMSQTGQEYSRDVGNVMAQTIPAMPLTAELGMLGQASKSITPIIKPATAAVVAPTVANLGKAAEMAKSGAMDTVQAVKNMSSKIMGDATEQVTPGTQASVGSAGVDAATIRQMAAQDLPVPVDLTKGQATRDFGQLRFEQEAAKNPELGAPIRDRMAQQNQAVRQSFDAWIDETGAQAPDSRAVGISVDKALRAKAARDKTEIRVAYKEAEKAGETSQPVSPQPLVDVLNNSVSAESTAPVLTAAKKELIRLGGAVEDANGSLVSKDMTLGNTEQLRKFVNKVTGADPTNIKFAVDLKKAIDTATEGAGGELYQHARSLRAKYADQYENHAVISDLLDTKRGSADRRVALEDVADRVIFRGSLDDMQHAKKVLQSGGEEGQQAWKEIQGSAIKYIKDEAIKNVQRDSHGNEIISPAALDKAVRRLDSEGKLDYLLGSKNAEKIRSVNDLAKVMFTTPPGSVNTSNTASVLLAALDMGVSSAAGLPLPVMSGLKMMIGRIKDKKLKARIQDSLTPQKTKF